MPWYLPSDAVKPDQVKNRSLFADKFPEFPDREGDKTARARTVQKIAGPGFEEGPAVSARLEALKTLSAATSFAARTGARMVLNHAGGVIENAGLALDRNSGIPFIPGSALKGIAREGARLVEARPEEVALVFGWADSKKNETDLPKKLPKKNFAGTVSFLPAFPTGAAPIERDIVTVHHPHYYQGKPDAATDDEPPIPNEFPAVAAGTEFLFVLIPASGGRARRVGSELGLPADFNPLGAAKDWLIAGITDHGVGAKTAAGYGWFDFDAEAEKQREQEEAEARRAEEEQAARDAAERARLDAMTPLEREIERIGALDDAAFAQLVNQLDQQDETVQCAVLESLRTSRLDTWKDWRRKKTSKTQRRAELVEHVAAQRGVELP